MKALVFEFMAMLAIGSFIVSILMLCALLEVA